MTIQMVRLVSKYESWTPDFLPIVARSLETDMQMLHISKALYTVSIVFFIPHIQTAAVLSCRELYRRAPRYPQASRMHHSPRLKSFPTGNRDKQGIQTMLRPRWTRVKRRGMGQIMVECCRGQRT